VREFEFSRKLRFGRRSLDSPPGYSRIIFTKQQELKALVELDILVYTQYKFPIQIYFVTENMGIPRNT